MEKNKLTLKGNLGSKPEYFKKENGTSYARLNLAINNYKKNEDGKFETTSTDWFNVTCFGSPNNLAERVAALEKGTLVRISGRLTTSKYEKNGDEISVINIVANDVEQIEPLRDKKTSEMFINIDKALESGMEKESHA